MFSALSQGSPIFLLDKTSTLDYKVGEVVGVSAPKFNSFGNTVDLKIKVDDSIQEFNNISSVSNYTSYNNGKIIISESKQSIQNEIEGILQNRRQILNNIDVYKEEIIQCELDEIKNQDFPLNKRCGLIVYINNVKQIQI